VLFSAWCAWKNRFELGDRYQVFISFKTEVHGGMVGLFVQECFARRRHKSYFAFRDNKSGSNLTQSVLRAVEEAEVFLIVVTPEYCEDLHNGKSWIRQELDHARNQVPAKRFVVSVAGYAIGCHPTYPKGFEWIGNGLAVTIPIFQPIPSTKTPQEIYKHFKTDFDDLVRSLRRGNDNVTRLQPNDTESRRERKYGVGSR
jgi:hypothetical protein